MSPARKRPRQTLHGDLSEVLGPAQRQPRGHRDRLHTRHFGEPSGHQVEEIGRPRPLVRRPRQGNLHGEDAVRTETGVHVQQPDERLDQQHGAHEQHHRQGHFHHDQDVAGAMGPPAARCAARAIAQPLVEIGARGLHRRHDPEQQPGQRRHRDGERNDRQSSVAFENAARLTDDSAGITRSPTHARPGRRRQRRSPGRGSPPELAHEAPLTGTEGETHASHDGGRRRTRASGWPRWRRR